MNSGWDIRLVPLSEEDIPRVQALLVQAADYFRELADAKVASDMAEQLFRDVKETPHRHLMGILQDEEMVGLLDFRLRYPAEDAAQLGLILLRPDVRGKGLGSLAMDIWETWLDVQTPIERVRASVPAHMRRAQRFFFKREYHLTGESYRVAVGAARPRLLILEKLLRLKSLEEETEEAPQA